MSRKRESGAQLLARLQTRPELSSLDPWLFGNRHPEEQSKPSIHHQHKIVELCGAEGVGKTEVALHCVARACLPPEWDGLSLPGLGAKVAFFDTEFKFNVLRLAIVLEKLIQCSVEGSRNESKSQMNRNSDRFESEPKTSLASDSDIKSKNQQSISSERREIDVINKKNPPDFDCHPNLPFSSESQPNVTVSPETMNTIVQDSLMRVQVYKVSSSLQLLASLISLEQSASCDPALTLIVIDSMSSFYWRDQAADPSSPSCTDARMKPIAKTISRCVSELGLTFLVVTAALLGGSKKKEEGHFFNTHSTFKSTGSHSDPDNKAVEHVDFLGKAWSSLCAKIVGLERRMNSVQGIWEYNAVCDHCTPNVRRFDLNDDGIKFHH